MKKLLLALALLLAPASAWAQCSGQFPDQTVCGNTSGVANFPRSVSVAGLVTTSIAVKTPVDVATTGSNITLSGDQTIDGVTLSSLSCWAGVTCRVLVKDQTTGSENGIYTPKAGAWSRVSDFNAGGQISTGTLVVVAQGTLNTNAAYDIATANPIVVGTTAITFRLAKANYTVSITDFGAKPGVDSTTAINNAITACSTTGCRVLVPHATSCYLISSTIVLGNGTNTSNSTVNNISLVGDGQGSSDGNTDAVSGQQGSSCLQWAGAASGTMIQMAGPITNPAIENIQLYGGTSNQPGTCVQIIHAFGSRVDNVSCSKYAGTAYDYTTRTAKTGVTFGTAYGEQINSRALSPTTAGAIAISLDGDIGSDSSTYNQKFIGGLYTYGGGTNSCGVRLGFADNNTFIQFVMNPQNAGTGLDVCFASPGVPFASWPHANVFYSVVGARGWGGTCGVGGRNWWLPFPSYEGTPAAADDCVNYIDYDNNWVAANSDITFKNKSGGGTSGIIKSTGGLQWGASTDHGANSIASPELYDSEHRVVAQTANLNTNGVPYGTSTNTVQTTAALTDGQLVIGQTGAAPSPLAVSGDATLSKLGVLTLTSVITAGGPIGSATSIPVITYDAKGRLTAVTTAVPSVTSVNGVSYPASYTSGGIPYASSSGAISSSGVLGANQIVLGGGAGAAPTSSSVLPNGTTATTQTASDNSTKVATTAYVDAAANQGAWTTFTPSATCNGTAVDGTNGSVLTYSKYWKQGKTVTVNIEFTCRTNAGTGAVTFNLPFTANGTVVINGRETFNTGVMVSAAGSALATSVSFVSAANVSTFAQGSKFSASGTYEAQ